MRTTIFFILTSIIFLTSAAPTFAVADLDGTGADSTGPIFNIPNLIPFANLGELFNVLLTLAFFAAGLAFFVNLLIGGIQWISSGGDPKALESARGRLMNAFVGLIIVVAAFAIALIIETVLGIKIVSGFQF